MAEVARAAARVAVARAAVARAAIAFFGFSQLATNNNIYEKEEREAAAVALVVHIGCVGKGGARVVRVVSCVM